MLEASPLNVRQSVSLAGSLAGHFQFFVTPSQVIRSFQSAQRLIASAAAAYGQLARNAYRETSVAFLSDALPHDGPSVRRSGDEGEAGRLHRALYSLKSESYIAGHREVWSSPKKNLDGPSAWPELRVRMNLISDANTGGLMASSADETRIGNLRKMFRSRACGSGDPVRSARLHRPLHHPSSIELGFFISGGERA